jgi:hypothetical protein
MSLIIKNNKFYYNLKMQNYNTFIKTNLNIILFALLFANSNLIQANKLKGLFADQYGAVPIGLAQRSIEEE